MLKDLELTTSTSQCVRVALPLTSLAQQMYRAANNMGYSELDYTAITAFMARINGMDTEKWSKNPKLLYYDALHFNINSACT